MDPLRAGTRAEPAALDLPQRPARGQLDVERLDAGGRARDVALHLDLRPDLFLQPAGDTGGCPLRLVCVPGGAALCRESAGGYASRPAVRLFSVHDRPVAGAPPRHPGVHSATHAPRVRRDRGAPAAISAVDGRAAWIAGRLPAAARRGGAGHGGPLRDAGRRTPDHALSTTAAAASPPRAHGARDCRRRLPRIGRGSYRFPVFRAAARDGRGADPQCLCE